MRKIFKLLFKDKEEGMILFTLMMLSMVFLALGLTMLYQADTNYQLSAVTRDNIEVFMTAETAYDACASRMLAYMGMNNYPDSLLSAWPGDNTYWPNYLIRVYDDPSNPTKFRLVTMPSIDWYRDSSINRSLSGSVDVTDDNANPSYFLITREQSLQDAGDTFKVSNLHFYRAWLEPDRFQDEAVDDRTAFLMVEAFRGDPNAPVDPDATGYRPQSHVLMQYRIRLARSVLGWENEDDAGSYGAGRAGTGSSISGGTISIGGGGVTRNIGTGT